MSRMYAISENPALVIAGDLAAEIAGYEVWNYGVDLQRIFNELERKTDVCYTEEFEGEVESLAPAVNSEDSSDDPNVFYCTGNGSYHRGIPLLFIPSCEQADPFHKAYRNIDEVVDEFVDILDNAGYNVSPELVKANICSIYGVALLNA